MKIIAGILVLALAACTPPEATTQNEVSPRQEPTNTTPGVHISGHAIVGVVRSY